MSTERPTNHTDRSGCSTRSCPGETHTSMVAGITHSSAGSTGPASCPVPLGVCEERIQGQSVTTGPASLGLKLRRVSRHFIIRQRTKRKKSYGVMMDHMTQMSSMKPNHSRIQTSGDLVHQHASGECLTGQSILPGSEPQHPVPLTQKHDGVDKIHPVKWQWA